MQVRLCNGYSTGPKVLQFAGKVAETVNASSETQSKAKDQDLLREHCPECRLVAISESGRFDRKIAPGATSAESQDHSHWMFRLETTKKNSQKEVDEVIETQDDDLKLPISVNDHAPTVQA